MKKPWKWVIAGSALLVVSVVAPTVVSLQSRFPRQRRGGGDRHPLFVRSGRARLRGRTRAAGRPTTASSITLSAMQKAEEEIEKKHGKPLGSPVWWTSITPATISASVTLSCDNAYQRGGGPIRLVMAKTQRAAGECRNTAMTSAPPDCAAAGVQ